MNADMQSPREAPRHFIDLDAYTDTLPKHWSAAVERFGEDSLSKHGIVPWHVVSMYYRLPGGVYAK